MDCQAVQLCSSQLFDTPERMDLPELEKAEKQVCNRLTFPLVVLGRHCLDIGDQCLLRPGLYVRTGVPWRLWWHRNCDGSWQRSGIQESVCGGN